MRHQHDAVVILHPYVTEKTMNAIDFENKLEFIVRRDATKKEIKECVEKLYDVKVESVNTKIREDGKHAIVKLKKEYIAADIATRIGIF